MAETAARGGAEWQAISIRLEELKGVLPSLADLPEAGPETAPVLLARLGEAVEGLRRRSIRDQIQLASLQELAESLMQSEGTERVLATLLLYLGKILDLEETLLLRRLPRRDDWAALRVRGAELTTSWIGPKQWKASWAAVARADDRTAGRAEGWPSGGLEGRTSRGDAPDPESDRAAGPGGFPIVLPLCLPRGAAGSQAAEGLDPEPLGILCLRPGQAEVADESWRPSEVARRVEGVLRALWHREEIDAQGRFRRQLLQAMRDGVLALDRDGVIVEINAAAARMLGESPASLRGAPLWSLEEAAPTLRAHLARALERKDEPPPQELILASAASTLPVNVAVSALRDRGEGFAGLVVNLTDLTAVRAMEEEIRRLDQFAALGRFAAGVAHEIRNPLAGIGAGVEYLAARFSSDAGEQEDLRFLQDEIRRLDRIVSDLLDYTRPRPLDPQRVEAGPLLGRIRQALAPLLVERRVELSLEGPEGLILWADPDRFEQITLNLVKNAVEASAPGGQVRIRWETGGSSRWDGAAFPREALVGAAPADGLEGVRFRIEDDGPGMTPEERARAFEPFFTSKGSGTGLGLSLSRTLVQQHGGRLELESRPGQGTVAILELPASGRERREQHAVLHLDR